MINDMKVIGLRNVYYKWIKSNKYPLFMRKHLNKEIRNIKDIHKGEVCFVVGNGPSLSITDLEKIKAANMPTFAANSIFKLYSKTNWRPTYLVFQDQEMIDGLASYFNDFLHESKLVFIRRDAYSKIKNNVKSLKNIIFPRLVMHIRKDKYFDFSEDIANCAYDGCTVTYFSIQLAYYMGFNKIYLIGVDHNFPVTLDEHDKVIINKNVKMHCFEDPKNVILNPARAIEATFAYKSAKLFLENHGVEIYNATRGGKLEVFSRIDIDELLNKEN